MRSTIVHAVLALWRAGTLAPWHVTLGMVMLLATSSPAQAQTGGVSAEADPFIRRGWHLELGGHGALETWNYNISHEELYGIRAGLTYGLFDGVVLTAGWPLYYVAQRGVDGYLLGATAGLRGRIHRWRKVSAFLEFELGVSEADTAVPPRGTRFNYLLLGGAGATVRLRPGFHLLAGMKWIHVSNNGLAGRHRNPDVEAVGPHVALLLRF